jgi:tRNA pseudouridine55 synthase
MFDGIIVIDKPAGITSHDVVARCRRILRTKKIGHTGTLDPFATGVMVVLVGKATRLAQFLDHDEKSYVATVRLGFATDTGDCDGARRELPELSRNTVTAPEIEEILPSFRGLQKQIPPMYSAKKIDGKKLYELARKGIEVAREPVEVNISELRLTSPVTFEELTETSVFELTTTVSAGTYIRVLAEDIGRALGGGAHLAALRRTCAGRFLISEAVTLDALENLVATDQVNFVSMNDSVGHLREVVLDEVDLARVRNGMRLRTESVFADDEKIRLTFNHELVAIAEFDDAEKTIRPRLVFV